MDVAYFSNVNWKCWGSELWRSGKYDENECFEDSNSMESHHFRPMEHSPTDGYGCGKARKNKEDKYCGVCGDRALGYNFDAISCESCKAFFRRNAPKGLDYFKCPYEEKCKMDVSNRRFCKRCRLRKCFEIGMRKEYILTEEEKMRKRMRIEENRRFRDIDKTKMQIGDVTSSQVRLRPLEPEESGAITEVVSAYHQSLEICVESEISREQPSMVDVVNIAEISVRRVIDMSKKIKSFKALSQADQIGLLKGGSIELLIIRSVITFDKDKQQFLDPYDKEKYAMTTEQLKIATDSAPPPGTAAGAGGPAGPGAPGGLGDMGGMGLFEDHMKFVKSLALDLQADETVLILLLMIALYSPDRPTIQDKAYVAQEQERYALLLLRYLESKHAPHVVRLLYPKLLMKLVDIRNLNEEHSQVLLRINPDGLQPLMKEVLEHNLEKKGEGGNDSSPNGIGGGDGGDSHEGCGSPSTSPVASGASAAAVGAAAAAAGSGERSPPLAGPHLPLPSHHHPHLPPHHSLSNSSSSSNSSSGSDMRDHHPPNHHHHHHHSRHHPHQPMLSASPVGGGSGAGPVGGPVGGMPLSVPMPSPPPEVSSPPHFGHQPLLPQPAHHPLPLPQQRPSPMMATPTPPTRQ